MLYALTIMEKQLIVKLLNLLVMDLMSMLPVEIKHVLISQGKIQLYNNAKIFCQDVFPKHQVV